MADKRTPDLVMLLRTPSNDISKNKKWTKVELYHCSKWGVWGKKYRMRINGKWNDTKEGNHQRWFTKWQFRDILFRSVKF